MSVRVLWDASDDEVRHFLSFHTCFLLTMATASVSSSSSNYSSAGDSLSAKLDANGTEEQVVQSNGSACQPLAGDEQSLIDQSLPRELLLRVFSLLDIISLCRAAQVSR